VKRLILLHHSAELSKSLINNLITLIYFAALNIMHYVSHVLYFMNLIPLRFSIHKITIHLLDLAAVVQT
jgi:hypothetical protein